MPAEGRYVLPAQVRVLSDWNGLLTFLSIVYLFLILVEMVLEEIR